MKIKQQYCLDGLYHYYDEMMIATTNRAFRFGDAIFESMFVSAKNAPLLAKHYERLQEAVNYWEMELPEDFTIHKIAKEIERLCNKNRLFQGARARLTVFRSGEGLYTPETRKASYLLEVNYYPVEAFTLNTNGWRLGIYNEEVKYPTKAARYKTAQCFLSIKGSLYKQKKGLDEVLLLSPEGEIVEAAAYNIFALKGDVLLTPSLESGCVAGVMRDTIIELAGDCGFTVEEVAFPLRILEEAEEVFLTNAVVGLRWVLAWEEERYFSNSIKKIVTLLNQKLMMR